MKTTVIGIGYVGLMQAVGLAELGHTVFCYDIDPQKRATVQSGKSHFREDGFDALLQKNLQNGRLIITNSIQEAIKDSNSAFLCVNTPPYSDGSANLRYLFKSAEDVAYNAKDTLLLVQKSTVPARTAKAMKEIASRYGNGKNIYVAVNPEFLAEGTMVKDFFHPDRIVVGIDREDTESSVYAMKLMNELYAPLNVPIDFTGLESAELVKHVSNFMLAQRVSTANLVSQICEKVGADVNEVMKLVGKEKRVGPHFLKAGIGYGGSCFPKDTRAFAAVVREYGIPPDIVESVIRFNSVQKQWVVRKIDSACGGLKGKTIAILGLAFKPGTDDVRESPSKDIIFMLQERGARIKAYDPLAMQNAKRDLPDIEYSTTPYDAVDGADAILLATEWPEFRQLDFKRIKELLRTPIIIDGRNHYDPNELKTLGFQYFGVGRR